MMTVGRQPSTNSSRARTSARNCANARRFRASRCAAVSPRCADDNSLQLGVIVTTSTITRKPRAIANADTKRRASGTRYAVPAEALLPLSRSANAQHSMANPSARPPIRIVSSAPTCDPT